MEAFVVKTFRLPQAGSEALEGLGEDSSTAFAVFCETRQPGR